MQNLILKTDSYKASHWRQYPPGTEIVYSYLESRGGRFDQVKFFGLQYILKKHFLQKVTLNDVEQADKFFTQHFGDVRIFNKEGWKKLVNKHNGNLPISIKAVREGYVCDVLTPLIVVQNTDPEFPWITNYVETLLMQVWYPITVATLSYRIKRLISLYLEKTGSPDLINFKLHDFGYRGVSSVESAGIGGAAHLLNFKGTDTLEGILLAQEYYGAKEMVGYSIPAAEHSTITSWGRENEADAFKNMINQFGSGSMYAVVSDSFNIYKACSNLWGDKLKKEVLNANGTLIIRPDSGDPVAVILGCLDILARIFGYEVNAKGYKVLPDKIRLIQGDGIDYSMIYGILIALKNSKWSADNIAFGMGGGLLQEVNRDTQQFAFKCSAIRKDGIWEDVYKDPITDKGKRSKRGRVDESKMVEVFRDGELLVDYAWEELAS